MARTPTSLGRGTSASSWVRVGATIFVAENLDSTGRESGGSYEQEEKKGSYIAIRMAPGELDHLDKIMVRFGSLMKR